MTRSIVDLATLPHRLEEIDNLWIPARDGCRLAAHAWLPEDAERSPVPAVLEYIPYRKRDGTASRDAEIHPYVAAHGYACLRVDMRGNGESDGVMIDEYLQQEQDDALDVIAWIAAQPWCDGRVGMMGKSWGGFNSLQVAALNPPALQAIITVCSTDDRYADDIHYRGGALLVENFGWSSTMLAYSSRPPDPALVGDEWRDTWLCRLQELPLLAETWLQHPLRDDYWRHGSVCEDFAAVRAPTLAVGGWLDGYSNAVPRLVRGLQAPARGIIGPWVHHYPHHAVPEPTIGFLQECVRWWNRWLKNEPNDALREPLLRVYRQSQLRPGESPREQAGDWLGFAAWPPDDGTVQCLYLSDGVLSNRLPAAGEILFSSAQDTGSACGEFFPMQSGPDLPGNQQADDARSLCFDGDILSNALTIAGAAELQIELRCDRPDANLIARLCDVAPDGVSARVTYAVLNLSHSADHATAQPLQTCRTYTFNLRMDDVAHTFPAGHRIRLALSNAYWPMVWPHAQVSTLTIVNGAQTFLRLPLWSGTKSQVAFAPSEISPPLLIEQLRAPQQQRDTTFDDESGFAQVQLLNDSGQYRYREHGLVTSEIARETYRIKPDDPNSAQARSHWTEELSRGDWAVRVETYCAQTSDATHFHLDAKIEAYEADAKVFEKTWRRSVERYHN